MCSPHPPVTIIHFLHSIMDHVGNAGLFLGWLTLFIAGGIFDKWDGRNSQSLMPFATYGEGSVALFVVFSLGTFVAFFTWVRRNFYTNESVAFAMFIPVLVTVGYSFQRPNMIMGLLYGVAVLLCIIVDGLCRRDGSGIQASEKKKFVRGLTEEMLPAGMDDINDV